METVIDPKEVRHCLQRLHSLTSDDPLNSFSDGQMGCAQETFEGILSYLHRLCVHPGYLDEAVALTTDEKFGLDNKVDSLGCSPKCPPH
mmetsp:Transcript_24449/g.37913  ORF Transcript_24449/g.37913 Transcript_24449/m.37913 type:complete len:89 (+) Transcript_24449:522-788(+)